MGLWTHRSRSEASGRDRRSERDYRPSPLSANKPTKSAMAASIASRTPVIGCCCSACAGYLFWRPRSMRVPKHPVPLSGSASLMRPASRMRFGPRMLMATPAAPPHTLGNVPPAAGRETRCFFALNANAHSEILIRTMRGNVVLRLSADSWEALLTQAKVEVAETNLEAAAKSLQQCLRLQTDCPPAAAAHLSSVNLRAKRETCRRCKQV